MDCATQVLSALIPAYSLYMPKHHSPENAPEQLYRNIEKPGEINRKKPLLLLFSGKIRRYASAKWITLPEYLSYLTSGRSLNCLYGHHDRLAVMP